MKILLVEDEVDLREALSASLRRSGHDVLEAVDGMQGWDLFRAHAIDVMITDWKMPNMDGLDLCRTVRSFARETYTYIIMLTAISGADRLIEALDAGADDFLTKPFVRSVLEARLRVAERILRLHTHVTRLEGLLSICCYCKNIRRDDGSWTRIEQYMQDRSELRFSHGICPTCMEKHHPAVHQRTVVNERP